MTALLVSQPNMSLVSGPGRGGPKGDDVPEELKLCVDNHVQYIKSLDAVRCLGYSHIIARRSYADSEKTNTNTG